jgi:hypothetical protein
MFLPLLTLASVLAQPGEAALEDIGATRAAA